MSEIHGVTIRDFVEEPLQVLSLGGGVQSTALLLLVKGGRLPRPDIVIHSDTGSEMPHTEPVIEFCRDICNAMDLPFAIVSSNHGKLHEYYTSKQTVPVIGVRSCTMNFKVLPQRRFIREIVGNKNNYLYFHFLHPRPSNKFRIHIDTNFCFFYLQHFSIIGREPNR